MSAESQSAGHWHYAAAVELVDGVERWSVAEVHPGRDGGVWGYTSPSEAAEGETAAELQKDLEMMLEDVKRHVLDLRGETPVLRAREA
ncbi:hypothetical protein ACFVU2_18855 [Leifsonia sp. NPDC058194]|uniref:hypothetical protein n=1 Tax=Leifsonia sp. NPDC058194 TaxID=3346374 RepID=UPI0036D9BB0F